MTAMCVIGSILLVFCWIFSNSLMTKEVVDQQRTNVITLIIINTLLSCAGSGLVTFMIMSIKSMSEDSISSFKVYEPLELANSLICGLVSITASCNNVSFTSAFFIGVIGSILYAVTVIIYERNKIDDPI